ncbi:FtsJ-like methyltransferase-domain-containing protein [Biscogniauxia mediterranea]|nr:FtsJ-like methyltransferase-domain-containing protein [Biscogniauxia mediterranea]
MQALSRIAAPRNGRLVNMAMAAPAAVRLLIAPGTWTAIHKPTMLIGECVRRASSSSSSTWKQRQANDPYARQAKVKGLRSRAAFKLLEIDSRYDIFKRGQLVVDLGYAPGSWSQVAMERTKPHGRVIGIDLIPAQPPKGVTAIQGNFLSPGVQYLVKEYLNEFAKQRSQNLRLDDSNGVVSERPSYIDAERAESIEDREAEAAKHEDKMVDRVTIQQVILSDMSEPWDQLTGFYVKTINNPYHFSRMMNTSGNGFRDHVRSMDLCHAALNFASETLRPGGHFICKFYHGAEDKILEANLKNLFTKVYREKPEASRVESREGYFVAMRRKKDVT